METPPRIVAPAEAGRRRKSDVQPPPLPPPPPPPLPDFRRDGAARFLKEVGFMTTLFSSVGLVYAPRALPLFQLLLLLLFFVGCNLLLLSFVSHAMPPPARRAAMGVAAVLASFLAGRR